MSQHFETISIIGLGYIGLPTAALFASRKVKVIGVDVNQHVVDTINLAKIHIVEPDLEIVVYTAVKEGYLRATTQPEPADAFLIAVPTPFKVGPTELHHPNIDYIESATKAVAAVLKVGNLVILESTSPVGTTEQMATWLAKARPDLTFPQTHGESSDIRIAYCPERVLPGQVLQELVDNDRIIGGMTPKCSDYAAQLYKTFVKGKCIITNARTAEMCKLTENSFRDVNIAFANELSIVCDQLDINVWELIKLANRHPRVNILQPGPGVGGHCIAVDPWFIVSQSPNHARLIRCAREVNNSKPSWVVEKVKTAVNSLIAADSNRLAETVTISCLGLSFKANIDDTRESPSVDIVRSLAREHLGLVLVAEPHLGSLPYSLRDERVTLVTTDEAIDRADVVVILVDHQSFKKINPSSIGTRMLIDTRGIWQIFKSTER